MAGSLMAGSLMAGSLARVATIQADATKRALGWAAVTTAGAVRTGSERRDEILAIAAELFAERGFGATTVREIADAAGILSGSLYHHFDSKESMVDDLVRGLLDRLTTRYREIVATRDDAEQMLRALVREAFTAIAEDRATVAVMVNEWNLFVTFPRFAYLRDVEEEAERIWVGVLARGMRSGAFQSELDPRLVYRMMRDAIWVSVRWYRPDGRDGPEHTADQYTDILLGGIGGANHVP
jgi:TetR/AcrR family transcriptional regulator, cholesterol catabolism regulator